MRENLTGRSISALQAMPARKPSGLPLMGSEIADVVIKPSAKVERKEPESPDGKKQPMVKNRPPLLTRAARSRTSGSISTSSTTS